MRQPENVFKYRENASQWLENEAAGNICIRLVGLVLYFELFADWGHPWKLDNLTWCKMSVKLTCKGRDTYEKVVWFQIQKPCGVGSAVQGTDRGWNREEISGSSESGSVVKKRSSWKELLRFSSLRPSKKKASRISRTIWWRKSDALKSRMTFYEVCPWPAAWTLKSSNKRSESGFKCE